MPIHLSFLALICIGWSQENSTYCSKNTYPSIFIWQYVLFLGCYALTLYFHRNDFFLKWHPDTDIVLKIAAGEAEMPTFTNEEKKNRIKARMIFIEQSRRFVCFYTWLTFLTLLSLSAIITILNKRGGTEFGCSADGTHWQFKNCGARFTVYFLHVVSCMQCGAIARVVFVRSVKLVSKGDNFRRMSIKLPQNDSK